MTLAWTADMECALFYSMIDHKPVGENKHFHMIFIYEKFNNLNEKKLSTNQLWDHLGLLYDLQSLNENEVKPFPNDEVEFSLPESIRKASSEQNSPTAMSAASTSSVSETPKSVNRLKSNKSSESFFKSANQTFDQMDTDRENSTTNSPKNNESGSNLSSSQTTTNAKQSVNDLSNNDNSSNEDASETSSKAATRSSSKTESSALSKKKKPNNANTKQTTSTKTASKKRK